LQDSDPSDDHLELELVTEDFEEALDLMRGAGFRLNVIFPADEPQSAVLSHGGKRVCLRTPGAPSLPAELPRFEPRFVLTPAGTHSAEGRAGMLYRDLIPGRLGGRYIVSHITIEQGGPVADWVHYHRIALQVIMVRRGWVRVVYEGEGEPFVMEAGDMVLQPPLIRHRVLESSPGLEVIEISAPALHATFADHELELPTAKQEQRDFGGQNFLRHIAAKVPWTPFGDAEAQETAMRDATGGIAELRIIRPGGASSISFEPMRGELVFGFVLEGTARLDHGGVSKLRPADAFVIPPDEAWSLGDMSGDLRLLHATTARLDAGA
jgi:quercetin dioxygenase-like cupin family protein